MGVAANGGLARYAVPPMRWYPDGIEVKAFCLIEHNNRWLLQEFFHPETHERYLRFLGGAVDKGEYAREAVIREIREELGSGLENVELLTVSEHIFPFQGDTRHQILFVFRGELTNTALFEQEEILIKEFGHTWRALWIEKEALREGSVPIRPGSLPYSAWL